METGVKVFYLLYTLTSFTIFLLRYLVEGLYVSTKNSILKEEKIRKFSFKTTYLGRNKNSIAYYPLTFLCACIKRLALI